MTLTHTNTNDWADSSGPFWRAGLRSEEVRGARRPDRLRPRGRPRDEPARDARRRVARLRRDARGRARGLAGAGFRLALLLPRALEHPAQPDRRADPGDRGEGGRRDGQRRARCSWTRRSSTSTSRQARRARAAVRGAQREVPETTRSGAAQETSRPAECDPDRPRVLDGPSSTTSSGSSRSADRGRPGLGTDFDGIDDPPTGLEDVSKLPILTEELLRRGHSEAVVRGVLGENFLAIWEKANAARAAVPARKGPLPAARPVRRETNADMIARL